MFLEELQKDPRFFMAVVITVVVSICIHELAHGIVAIMLGDRTPIESGHMTLNPAVHMGIVSVICLLMAGIAWGAMPVDPRRLRGRYADALVAAAGPASNVLMALLAIVGLGLWQRWDWQLLSGADQQVENIRYFLYVFGIVNFNLALFNLIPVPPLDGSRIVGNFSQSYAKIMQTVSMTGGFLVMFVLVFSAAGTFTQPVARNMAMRVLQLSRGY